MTCFLVVCTILYLRGFVKLDTVTKDKKKKRGQRLKKKKVKDRKHREKVDENRKHGARLKNDKTKNAED